jgi:uncharacterized protein
MKQQEAILRYRGKSGLVALGLMFVAGTAAAQEVKLPKTSIWTSYDVGASGYVEASAMADAFMKKFDTRVRIVPSGTSIGRLLPLKTDRANYGFLANEVYFAAEGTYDFSTRQWGPQDLRVVLARLASNGLACGGDAGIKTLQDLKGKKIGYVKGNPSVNVKTDAMLGFAGLKQQDVEPVWFGSYSALKTAVIAGQIDCFGSVASSANMREIEASPRGLAWPEFSPDDKDGWARLAEVADFFTPYKETQGAGISEQNPKWLVGYRYPTLTAYANTSADEVYNLTKAADLAFNDYKNATASAENWGIAIAGKPPADAPYHEGAIRYLKEKGVWTAESQAWQDKRIARLETVKAAWKEAEARFEKEKPAGKSDDDAWLEVWEKVRAEKKLGPAS